jgi:hypothetical protein
MSDIGPDVPSGASGIPKPVLYGGIGLVLIGGVYLYEKHKSAAASTSSASTASTPYGQPATGTGVIEPIILNSGGSPGPAGPTGATGATGPAATPAKTTVPAPAPASVPRQTSISAGTLNTEVGALSKGLKTPTKSQVAAEEKTLGSTVNSRVGQQELQAWNVGQITSLNSLKTPQLTAVKAEAQKLYPNFASLDPTSQNIALEQANVNLLQSMNPGR